MKPDDAQLLSPGLDLKADNDRLREQNTKLINSLAKVSLGTVLCVAVGLFGLLREPERERLAVDPAGRVYPVTMLTKNDPPDARVTAMVDRCISDLLNHAFHNFQTTVERAVGGCVTGGGSLSVRRALDPLLERMKKEQMNLAGSFVIQPFIHKRGVENNSRTYEVQATIQVGYRGTSSSIRPVEYALSANVIRVPFESHPEGLRIQNLVLALANRN